MDTDKRGMSADFSLMTIRVYPAFTRVQMDKLKTGASTYSLLFSGLLEQITEPAA